MDEFIKLCFDHWPLLSALVALIILTVIITTRINKNIHHWTGKITTSENDCKKIVDIEQKITAASALSTTLIGKMDTQTDKLTVHAEKFTALSLNITTLIAFLTTKHKDLQTGLFKSHSPIQLTESGLDLLNNSGGKEYVENHISTILIDMESQAFKSGLDVQNYASIISIKNFNSDEFIKIRDYIYQHPVYKVSDGSELQVTSQIISQIIGIYIRDKYFDKHPELKDKD